MTARIKVGLVEWAKTKTILTTLGFLGVVAGLATIIWLPPLFATLEAGPVGITPMDWRGRVDLHRQTVVQILGGVVVAFGLAVAFHRSRAAMRAAAATEDGNMVERFTQAINHLGAFNPGDGTPLIVVRLGGIYSLEQIAKGSPEEYHWQVMEILTAYIRKSSPRYNTVIEGTIPRKVKTPAPGEDIQAALTVLSRRKTDADPIVERLDLTNTNLSGMKIRLGHFPNTNFVGANLDGTVWEGCDFRGADFTRASLLGAWLVAAKLQQATMEETDLRECNLQHSEMNGARLIKAVAGKASLIGANLSGAVLTDANFSKADLRETIFSEAKCIRAIFIEAQMEKAICSNADMSYCNFSDAKLRDANLQNCELYEADFTSAQIERAKVDGAELSNANLLNLKGWTWRQLCSAEFDELKRVPDGSEGITKERFCKAHEASEKMGKEEVSRMEAEREGGKPKNHPYKPSD